MTAFKDWLNGLTSKTTPVDADEVYVRDSSGTPSSKKLTWANLKATLADTFLSLTGGTVAGGTRTTSGSTLTITETLNNAGVTFPGALVVDVTDTASNAASLLMDLRVGGVSKASIRKDGRFLSEFGNYAVPTYSLPVGGGLATNGTNVYLLDVNNTYCVGVNISGALMIGIGNDALIYRDAANTLAQRNETNAQTSRLYGTYTDGSNYRRVAISMTTGGVASIAPEGAGTGASGNVLHISGLPTSNPGAGILWNDSGTVKVGT